MKITEAKDVTVYKRLVQTLGEYCKKYPATGMDVYFDKAIEIGKKILPKDKRAQYILDVVLFSSTSSSEAVQNLLNMRFAELEMCCKPLYKDGRKTKVAYWSRGDRIYDRVRYLLNMDNQNGMWTDMEGKKVTLINLENDMEVQKND